MPQCISAVAFPSWKLDNQLAIPPGNKNNNKSLPDVPSALKRKKKTFFKIVHWIFYRWFAFFCDRCSALRIWFVTEHGHSFCGNFVSTLCNKEYNSEASEESFCDAVLLDWWHNCYRFPERYKEESEAGYWLERTVWIKSHFFWLCLQVRWQVESTSGV